MSKTIAPKPPAHLPKAVAAKWSETHATALKQAERDMPEDSSAQRAFAIRAANAHVKVADPANHAEAQKLVDAMIAGDEDGWKIIGHGQRKVDGKPHLSIVTVNGKKLLFPIPDPKVVTKTKAELKAEADAVAAAAATATAAAAAAAKNV